MPDELTNPNEFPIMFAEVWETFNRLSATRNNNGFGASPFSYAEIESYQNLTGTRLDSFEIELLKRLDVLELNSNVKPNKG